MPSIRDYYQSMRPTDVETFLQAIGGTLLVGGLTLYVLFRWVDRKVNAPAAVPQVRPLSIPRRPQPAMSSTSDDVVIGGVVPTSSSEASGGDGAIVLPKKERRIIPRAAQATLVERGSRLLASKEFSEALTCFLALLYAAIESDEKVLPTQLTECLRGVGHCYIGLGKPEVGVRFFQAERHIFEEMVVLAARPPGQHQGEGGTPQRSIIASLLLGKKGQTENIPKRCYTLNEVADACTKLGHHDIALAYRVKAAALKQKVSGEALDPESADAALLAQSLNLYQNAHKDGGGSGGQKVYGTGTAAAASTESSSRGIASGNSRHPLPTTTVHADGEEAPAVDADHTSSTTTTDVVVDANEVSLELSESKRLALEQAVLRQVASMERTFEPLSSSIGSDGDATTTTGSAEATYMNEPTSS